MPSFSNPNGCDSATTLNQEKASLQLEVCPKKDDVALLVVISLGCDTTDAGPY
jgi:hypothetical protein